MRRLRSRAGAGCRLDPPGHKKFADGTVLQWGTATATPAGTQVTLAVPLTVELWGVSAGQADAALETVPIAVTDTTLSGFKVQAEASVKISYLAVGR
jgi:hypothetical protein